VGAKFVVCHNAGYRLLKDNLVRYREDAGPGASGAGDGPGNGAGNGAFPPFFDVREPVIDFVALAGALGVPAAAVNRPEEVAAALRAMLDHDGPYLVQVALDPEVG
jgi:benzoylformate decarboxylase